jgi:hypothetical protein
VQQAVLHRQRDAIGDRAQLLLVRAPERLGAAADQQHDAERLLADHQARPRDVRRAVALQPRRERHLAGLADQDGRRGGQASQPRQREAAFGHVGLAHAPLSLDADRVVSADQDQGDVGREQLRHLDRGVIDHRVEVGVVAEHGDHLAQPGRARQDLCGVALGRFQPLAQLRVLGLERGSRRVHQKARMATLELWMPVDPVTRANSPQV